MTALVNQAQGFLSTGVNPQRLGNDHPSIAPYGPIQASDGLLLLAVGTDAQFARLVTVLDDVALSSRVAWRTNAGRVVARDELRETLNRIFVQAPTERWLELLGRSGVPCAPILDVAGAFAQDQIASGDFVGTMSTLAGETRAMRSPLRIDGVRPGIRRGPRAFGEDTDELFGA
jgi:formyl-CoA transferase